MTININISIEKKHLIIFSCLIAIFGIVLVTNAYNPSGTGGTPEVMGHSADELDVEFGDSIQKLQQIFNSLDNNRDGVIDDAEYAWAVEWNNINNRPSGLDDGDDVGITSESDPVWEEEKSSYATKDYVDANTGGQACNWNGWEPEIGSGKSCGSCTCNAYGYQTQLYCSGGEITNIRRGSYCTSCNDCSGF